MNLPYIRKKLLIKEIESLPLVNYEPASLKEWNTGWLIEYRIFNPDTGTLEKKRLKFEKIRKRIGSDSKARKYARVYCDAINEKLESIY